MGIEQSKARFIVALHIGSDLSGFAYAREMTNPEECLVYGMPPRRGKHVSAIYYEPGDAATAKVKSWGNTAHTDHERAVQLNRQRHSEISEADGTYFESFQSARKSSTALLQKGFTLTQVISDYLRLMGAWIVSTLQHSEYYGHHVSMNNVEWCVVLAHEWGDHAMELMRTSMERAGLVQSEISRGGSPYPLRFVHELDAASYHSLREFGGSRIQVGKKLLVVDLALVSSYITVQEVTYSVERSKFEVKQVADSSVGVLDGRKQNMWMELLIAKMLPVQDNALEVHAFKQFFNSALTELSWARCCEVDKRMAMGFKYVEGFKCVLPINVQKRWKQFDVEDENKTRISYDVIEVSLAEFETVMKPYLENCVALIAPQLLSHCTPDVKAILLVGELCNFTTFSAKIFKDLTIPVRVVTSGVYVASEGALQMVVDQVLPFTWTGGGKLSKDGDVASSSDGDGIIGRSSLPNLCKELPERGSTSPVFKSSNALGGDGVSIPWNEPNNTKVEDGAVASSSDGDGITWLSGSLKICEELPGRGSASPVFKSSNALGGGGASIPPNEPNNTRVEGAVKKYSWDQVLQMTYGLSSRELGEGGFGTVYLGKFENGKEVAVKVLNQSSQESKLETFVNEVNLLIQVNHVNLVKLLGYCQDKRNVVIYEYAEEGSIGDHLHGDKARLNDWKQRLSIMLQAAYGLDYLHTLCSPTIIHRDIKSENILLTKNMVAKVADFGISKLMGADVDMKTYLTTRVIGTPWYIDPEYQKTGQLRQSSDVYSFGIVLLEMISGQKPYGIGAWVNKLYGSGGGGAVKAIADSSFNGNYNPKAMKVVIKLAISCIDANGTSRPMMGEVVGELKKAQSIEEKKKSKSWF